MSRVPVITSPCPFRWSSAPKPGQDFCGQCQRQVHNLDYMSAGEREIFLSGCSGEVCVSYAVQRPLRAKVALGTLVAVAALGSAASAQAPRSAPEAPVMATPEVEIISDDDLAEVWIGGTLAGDQLQWVDEAELAKPDKPALPEITTADWLPTPKA
jgi:hypothetical protein